MASAPGARCSLGFVPFYHSTRVCDRRHLLFLTRDRSPPAVLLGLWSPLLAKRSAVTGLHDCAPDLAPKFLPFPSLPALGKCHLSLACASVPWPQSCHSSSDLWREDWNFTTTLAVDLQGLLPSIKSRVLLDLQGRRAQPLPSCHLSSARLGGHTPVPPVTFAQAVSSRRAAAAPVPALGSPGAA
jgi:hypothetical protein